MPPFDPPTANCDIPDPDFDTSLLDPCVHGELVGSFVLTRESEETEDGDTCDAGEHACDADDDEHDSPDSDEACTRGPGPHDEDGACSDRERSDDGGEHEEHPGDRASDDEDDSGDAEAEMGRDEVDAVLPVPDGRVCVRAVAQGGGSASVSLGRAELLGPGDFGSGAAALQRVVDTTSGTQRFEAELEAGPPGSEVRIDVWQSY